MALRAANEITTYSLDGDENDDPLIVKSGRDSEEIVFVYCEDEMIVKKCDLLRAIALAIGQAEYVEEKAEEAVTT